MTPKELQERTLEFALRVFKFVRPLLREPESRHVSQQLLRCATSVAANYRAACLARSRREWVAKVGVIREEADETVLWLLFVARADLVPASRQAELDELAVEGRQLARIFAVSYRTSRDHLHARPQLEPEKIDR